MFTSAKLVDVGLHQRRIRTYLFRLIELLKNKRRKQILKDD